MNPWTKQRRWPFPLWLGILESLDGLNRTEGRGKEEFTPFLLLTVELGHPNSSPPGPQIGIYTIGSPGSEAFGFRLNCITGSSGSPGSSQNLSGSSMVNMCIYVSARGGVSVENPD